MCVCFFVCIVEYDSKTLLYVLTQEYLHDLYDHFTEKKVETHMYASQWFLTIFTAKFPLSMTYHVMDIFLCEVS